MSQVTTIARRAAMLPARRAVAVVRRRDLLGA
jgi:hypothetical protein